MIEICPSADWRPIFKQSLEFAQHQVRTLIERDPDFYPMYTQGGHWRHTGEAWTHWCDGFLPGMMWIFHRHTKDPDWARHAEHYSTPLEPRKMDRNVHDLGFIFLSTYHRWYKQTDDEKLNDVVIQAGQTLAKRFQKKGHYLSSFIGPESIFIDVMANVGIIFYAALKTGDDALLRIAMDHCLTTRRVLIRGDGSSSHEGIFDLNTGEFLRQSTHQGWRGDSCWSRGLAWAIYGFTSSYRAVKDPRFLHTAQCCADFFIRETPADGVPPMDYDTPSEEPQYRESSAAAITAAGLLQLAKVVPDSTKGALYAATAQRILLTLCSSDYLAKDIDGWEGILRQGIYHLRKDLGVSESVMWGDYFFVEALDRALRDTEEN